MLSEPPAMNKVIVSEDSDWCTNSEKKTQTYCDLRPLELHMNCTLAKVNFQLR